VKVFYSCTTWGEKEIRPTPAQNIGRTAQPIHNTIKEKKTEELKMSKTGLSGGPAKDIFDFHAGME